MTSQWSRWFKFYVGLHGVWLACYALLGKGFAYLGWPPLFVGELLLAFGCIALITARRLSALLRSRIGKCLIVFTVWQAICAVPYIGTYGIDTLRDSAIWGYSTFAWITAALVLKLPGFVDCMVGRYRSFAQWFAVLGPCAWLATFYLADTLPRIGGTSITIPLVKGGDYCVHLAGALAFFVSGVAPIGPWFPLLIFADAVLGLSGRGGLVSFAAAVTITGLLSARFEKWALVALSILVLLVVMGVADFHVSVPGTARELSLDQLNDGFNSLIGDSGRRDLEGTKNWRFTWWKEIVDYTFGGPYFWMGKGYGVNLAQSDGFQPGTYEDPLRSPHNSHLTMLARSGVPGLALWTGLQIVWAASMFIAHKQAKRLGLSRWGALFAWMLAYWMGFEVCAAFDVFLEGPMAGIPFWSLFGFGWGARILFEGRLRQMALETKLRDRERLPDLAMARMRSPTP